MCDSMPFPYGWHVMRTLLAVMGLLVAKTLVCLGTIPKRSRGEASCRSLPWRLPFPYGTATIGGIRAVTCLLANPRRGGAYAPESCGRAPRPDYRAACGPGCDSGG